MTGRTLQKFNRVYIDGYDMSGYSRGIGPLSCVFEPADLTAQMGDAIKGYLPGQAEITPTLLNGVFDNTPTSGLHVIGSAIAQSRIVMIPVGIQAAPASGDVVFMGQFIQTGYQAEDADGPLYAQIPFGLWDVNNLIAYEQPWGHLVHAKGAETGANAGANDVDGAAATALGGWLMYHVFAGNGTATISIDDSANDAAWTALAGATTGSINCSVVQKGIVALGKTATVRRYLRWQLVLGTATTVTFALAFVRGR